MSSLTTVTGRALILPEDNIDTDRIIPARFLKCVTFDELGSHVFEDDRAAARKAGETHPFDALRFQGSSILMTGANFGSGSSREHAVHALMKWGVRAVVSYGDYSEIFFTNALSNGLPPLIVDRGDWETVVARLQKDVTQEVRIDLEKMMLACGNLEMSVTFQQSSARETLITGSWDRLGVLLEAEDEIEQTLQGLPYCM